MTAVIPTARLTLIPILKTSADSDDGTTPVITLTVTLAPETPFDLSSELWFVSADVQLRVSGYVRVATQLRNTNYIVNVVNISLVAK